MEKTINKLWAVLTLGLVCVLIFGVFAGGALRRTQELQVELDAVESRISRLSAENQEITKRLEQLEFSLADVVPEPATIAPASASMNQASIQDVVHVDQPKEAKEELKISNLHPMEIPGSNFERNMSSIRTLGKPENRVTGLNPVMSLAERHLQDFRNTLKDDQLIEFSNRVDAAMLDLVSAAVETRDLSLAQEKQLLQLMQPGLEKLREVQEKSILLRMMSERVLDETSGTR